MKKLILASSITLICGSALAHDIWIRADHHEIHSKEQTVFALDVSRSGNTYVAESNHNIKQLIVEAPSGNTSTIKSSFSGKVKEVFEMPFSEHGTYFLKSPMTQVFLSFYRDSDGKKHKIRMPKSQWHTLPKGSKPIKAVEKQIITQTYISYNGFSDIKPQLASSLVIKPLQHPNKIRPNQAFSFELTHHGKTIKHGEVSLTSTNQFYAMDSEKLEMNLTPAQKGIATFTVDKPGRYLFAVEYQIDLPNDSEATERSIERFLSFEVTD